MRVYGALLRAFLAAAVMTTSDCVARANPSTITRIDSCSRATSRQLRRPPLRYIEGDRTRRSLRRRADCWPERACGWTDDGSLSGHLSDSLRRKPHLMLTPSSSRRQTAGEPFSRRDRPFTPAVTGPNADPVASAISDGFLLSHEDFHRGNPMANGIRRRAPERARDRRGCRPGFWPLAWRRFPKRGFTPAHLPPSHPGRGEPSRVVRKQLHRRRFQRRSRHRPRRLPGRVHPQRQRSGAGDQRLRGAARAISLRPSRFCAAHARPTPVPTCKRPGAGRRDLAHRLLSAARQHIRPSARASWDASLCDGSATRLRRDVRFRRSSLEP